MESPASTPAALVLGTAQLGMRYGIANRTGAPSPADAHQLVKRALALGVRIFDTARAYGQSEARLGRALAGLNDVTLITKLDPLGALADDTPRPQITAAVRGSVDASMEALCRPRLDTLLLHRTRHLRTHAGAVFETLLAMQQEGLIGTLGASVQSPEELRLALSFRGVRHIQLPLNILDWRWCDPALATRFELRPEVTVHARSVFLQGLLAAEDERLWPTVPGLDVPALLKALTALAETLGREGIPDLCLAYARAMPFVHGVVIGAETIAQLERNVALCARPPLDPDERAFVARFLPPLPETLLNPALWPPAKAA